MMKGYTAAYLRYYKEIYMRCRLMLGDAYEAEDVTHDVFIALYERWDKMQDRENLRKWLSAVAHNKCVDLMRKRARQVLEDEMPQMPSTDDSIATELMEDAREAVCSLPQKQREVFELAFIQGYHNKEIAALLHVPASTVKGRLQSCSAALRKILFAD